MESSGKYQGTSCILLGLSYSLPVEMVLILCALFHNTPFQAGK